MVIPTDTSRLLNLMASARVSSWDTPEDLARANREGLWDTQSVVRVQRSRGRIRLSGAGVTESSADLDAVGEIMIVLQRLVSATGASLRGFKSLKGRLGMDIRALTQLNLRAAPAMGSIILSIEPRSVPATELAPGGVVALLDQPKQPLVDESVEEVFALLSAAKKLGPDVDTSEFLAKVVALGPRVASALRDFAKDVRDDEFDLDFQWEEPGMATQSIKIGAADAQRISEVVVARELDRDTVRIEGVLRTVSDVGPLVIELEDGSMETLKTTSLAHTVIVGLNVGDRAKFEAEMRVNVQPGGGQTVNYAATAFLGLVEPNAD